MRYELKIPINCNLDLYFKSWIDTKYHISKLFNQRKINSVYYDTESFNIAQDNLAGISDRQKYRIRWYNNDKDNFNYEIKLKKNNLGKKIVLFSNKILNNFEDLYSKKNIFLNNNVNKHFQKKIIYSGLKPVIKIDYLRTYYLYKKKVRITYDRKMNYQFIDKFDFKNKVIEDYMNVVEIKFEPDNYYTALELIKDTKFAPKRFSKYLRGLYMFNKTVYI
jgi:SPX domain protein involved in polyphosphate accumulation|tara:strand:- start:137 stop:796 length:660 start_codon:yes stop_codon:yes gene_type:complete